ncbi:hypothetical protein L0F63_006323, partial [Massospora cicadina]
GQRTIADAEAKRAAIRDSFSFTYNNYRKYAMGQDEIMIISGRPVVNTLGGWGVTLVETLDTLWLMGFKDEFNEAVQVIGNKDFTRGNGTHPFREVTNRILGGLISAYELSNNTMLLKKANQLANLLKSGFSTAAGLPFTDFDFADGYPTLNRHSTIANVASFQLEFVRLSQITGDLSYRDAAISVISTLDRSKPGPGLHYVDLDIISARNTSTLLTYDTGADSFYEYLIKLYPIGTKRGSSHSAHV